MVQMIWILKKIEFYLPYIQELFEKNRGHKHEDNYIKWPLFEHTKFARMAFDDEMNMIYYSAGIERPEYNGSIRIMSRHTRDIQYNFGGHKADLKRGLETLNLSTKYALKLGYKDIWFSREESPKLLEYFKKNSEYNWDIKYDDVPGAEEKQWILNLNY